MSDIARDIDDVWCLNICKNKWYCTYWVKSVFINSCFNRYPTVFLDYVVKGWTDFSVPSLADEPDVKIEGFDGNWYLNRQDVQLTCRADANPPVTIYQWKL